MNLTIGLFGLLGFFASEISFILDVWKNQTPLKKAALFSKHYAIILLVFSCIVFTITCLFAVPNLSANVWPITSSNISVAEAIRSIIVGMASIHIYKTSSKSTIPGMPRTETISGDLKELTFLGVMQWWRRYEPSQS